MAVILADFFKHNTWANLRLLAACRDLSVEQLAAEAPGTYGRIDATLVHLVAAEERYLGIFTGAPPRPALREHEPFPGVAELERLTRANGEGLEDVASRARSGKMLRGTRRGEPYAIPAAVLLIQAINHATEHRAHVMTTLSQQGIQPPAIDGWAYGEHLKRR